MIAEEDNGREPTPADNLQRASGLDLATIDLEEQEPTGSVVSNEKESKQQGPLGALETEQPSELVVNYRYLTLYVTTLALNSIAVSWTTGGNNQTANVIAAKLDWTAEETRSYNSAINFASQIGKALGAIAAGQVIQSSRKDAFLRFNVLAMLTTLIMQYLSIPTLIIGKFTNGFVVTICHISAIKMVNETVPAESLGRFGSFICCSSGIGYMLVLGLGLGLPFEDYSPSQPREGENLSAFNANQQDSFWRVIYAFPLLINGLMLLSFWCNINADPIMFCLSRGDEEQALKLIERIYEDKAAALEKLKSQVHRIPSDDTLPESFYDQLFGNQNFQGTVTLMMFTTLNQFSTVGVLYMYSNRLMTIVNEQVGDGFIVPANLATQLMGLSSCLSVFFSLILVQRYSRKSLLTAGQVTMTILLFLMVAAIYMRLSIFVVVCIMLIQVSYQLTLGPIHWIYIPEVTSDAQFGCVALVHWADQMLLSIVTEFMFKYLEPQGTFLTFAVITTCGIPFMSLCIKETDGLTEREKRQLYKPVMDQSE